MPTEYEKYLTKRIRTYMWGSDTPPPIAMNHLTRPQNVGGRNILDLKAQNEAISIMKLKKLLDYSEDCPTASDTAIAIIIAAIPKSLQEKNHKDNSISNIFLQTIYMKNRYTSRALPNEIRKTLNIGAKYNLHLDVPKLSLEHKIKLPAWHHIGITPGARHREYNSHARCLRTQHKVETISDLIIQEQILEDLTHNIENITRCECHNCKKYRKEGCTHPHACFNKASQILNDIAPKFNPQEDDHLLSEEITKDDRAVTIKNAIGPPEKIKIFNPDTTTKGSIHENLQIFTNPTKCKLETVRQDPKTQNPPDITAYTNGSCDQNSDKNAKASLGVWFSTNNPNNIGAPIGKTIIQSNNMAKLLAIHSVLILTPSKARLHIKTDSAWAIKALCENIRSHTDNDFINISHANLLKPITNKLRKRARQTSFEWVKAHTGITGNEKADHLAAEGAQKTNPQKVIFFTSPKHNYM